MQSSLLPSPNGSQSYRPPYNRLINAFRSTSLTYLFSFHNLFGLFFFTTATIALISHKIFIISLHGPFSALQVLFLGPFTFTFDVLTLALLRQGLISASSLWRRITSFLAIIIIITSSTFTSMYFEANTEMVWGRSVEVCQLDAMLMLRLLCNGDSTEA
jgi:hypothetical protein